MTTPNPPAEQAAVVRGNAVWLPPGSPPVTVGDYVIKGGLVYLGSAVPAAYAAIFEPALIDPRAPLRRVRLDQETPTEGERPAYAELTPGARTAYLEWLATGRTGPTQAAHLWLFLYGLERRVLVDLVGTVGNQQEYAAIAAEVAGLAERYPHAAGFTAQVAEFTDLLDALIGLNDPALQPPPVGPRTGELPMRLRVGIGRYVARGLPISAGWAYAWYAYSPRREWGPEATRRPGEFRRAFAARYAQAYPSGGIVVPAPADGLVLEYQPASPGFADRKVRIHTQLPDIRDLDQPLEELACLAARAEADLAGATQPATPPGSVPPDVHTGVQEPAGTTGTGSGGAPEQADLTRAGATNGLRSGRRVTLDIRPHLAAAEALLRLVTVAGIADGYVRAVRRHVVDALGLTVTERQRLDDRLDQFVHRRPAAATVRQRFAALLPEQQRKVADLLIAAAGADGVLEPGQVAVLAAVFELLGNGAAELQRRLGDLEVAAVVDESAIDTTVLDEEVLQHTLTGALATAGLVDALVAPVPRYATCP